MDVHGGGRPWTFESGGLLDLNSLLVCHGDLRKGVAGGLSSGKETLGGKNEKSGGLHSGGVSWVSSGG